MARDARHACIGNFNLNLTLKLSGPPQFPYFYFPHFIFSAPPSRHFAPFVVKMPWSIQILVSRFSTFSYFIFSATALIALIFSSSSGLKPTP